MDEKKILIKALTVEAEQKPNERIFIGFKSYTYKEFASMLNHNKKLDKQTRKLVQNFINQALKMFRENEEFRKKMMMLAGENP
ncbi:MAG: hypothetical protein QW175_04640 [Candidatus Bathyarchaeia archaeon]